MVFLALLHYPLFLNYLVAYKAAPGHIDKKGICAARIFSNEPDRTLDCRLCLFLEMARGYWNKDAKHLSTNHRRLSKRILNDWEGGKRKGQEQDTEEFYMELMKQFQGDIHEARGSGKTQKYVFFFTCLLVYVA